ncbi:hypothetical protein RHGRI_011087 [Rhododendron griersonianum]|uniref:Uncharacterized protein n=1 Tax=Rhododendron griersonianum TaxID=479676 RepID=A0AAV6KKL3_9ERIC|nr:hypothetical protein RHGRI_011087 [Rhododendron griersonianum]
MAVEGEKLVVKLATFKQNDKREFSQQCMHKPQSRVLYAESSKEGEKGNNEYHIKI